jgi:hypothetical protein
MTGVLSPSFLVLHPIVILWTGVLVFLNIKILFFMAAQIIDVICGGDF